MLIEQITHPFTWLLAKEMQLAWVQHGSYLEITYTWQSNVYMLCKVICRTSWDEAKVDILHHCLTGEFRNWLHHWKQTSHYSASRSAAIHPRWPSLIYSKSQERKHNSCTLRMLPECRGAHQEWQVLGEANETLEARNTRLLPIHIMFVDFV